MPREDRGTRRRHTAALALTATGAQAHGTVAYHGNDFVAVTADHRTTSVWEVLIPSGTRVCEPWRYA
jgi:hypothetical protein